MPALKIRNISLPLRCEICHQADCFDARLNFCSRCAGSRPLEVTYNPGAATAESATRLTTQTRQLLLRIKFCCLMAFTGFFLGSLGKSPATAVLVMSIGILLGVLISLLFQRTSR